jgi:hypothetical protein
MVSKLAKMQRTVPSLLKPTVNPYVRGLLYAWSGEDDLIVQAVKDAKEQIFVKTAQLEFLDVLGSNVGVFRPTVFNLSDELFRQLIPLLSFSPKQVLPTIRKVLEVFWGIGNSVIAVHEINPNEIKVTIPSTVPSLRRTLRGSHHFHVHSGTIISVDNFAKEIVVDLEHVSKSLRVDEWKGAVLGQGFNARYIESNTAGNLSVTLQFSSGADLSVFASDSRFVVAMPTYAGSFFPDLRMQFSVTKARGVLGQSISIGQVLPVVIMQDASSIPNQAGTLVLDYGKGNQEGPIKYYGRPNNSTLFVDPVYTFAKNHSPGEMVNVIVKPYSRPQSDGSDLSIYLVGVTAARDLAMRIVESLVAAGVVIRWDIVGPIIEC